MIAAPGWYRGSGTYTISAKTVWNGTDSTASSAVYLCVEEVPLTLPEPSYDPDVDDAEKAAPPEHPRQTFGPPSRVTPAVQRWREQTRKWKASGRHVSRSRAINRRRERRRRR